MPDEISYGGVALMLFCLVPIVYFICTSEGSGGVVCDDENDEYSDKFKAMNTDHLKATFVADNAKQMSDPNHPTLLARQKEEEQRELNRCLEEVRTYASQGYKRALIGEISKNVRTKLKEMGYTIRISKDMEDEDAVDFQTPYTINW